MSIELPLPTHSATEQKEKKQYSPSLSRLRLPEKVVEVNQESLLFICRDPGAASYWAPVAEVLAMKGIPIYLLAIEAAETKFESFFQRSQIQKDSILGFPATVRMIFVAGSVDTNFEIEQIKNARALNPLALIIAGEDAPGGLASMIPSLIQHGYPPDFIFTASQRTEKKYRQDFNKQLSTTSVVTLGQPAIDAFRNTDIEQTKQKVREALNIGSQDTVVTFVGLPLGDMPLAESKEAGFNDLNSLTLRVILEALSQIANKHPQRQFTFIYKPHPRELNENYIHPYLTKYNTADNVKIIASSSETWSQLKDNQQLPISTVQIGIASDAVINIASTVNQEVTLSGALSNQKESITIDEAIPVMVLLPESDAFLDPLTIEEFKRMATVLLTSVSNLASQLEKVLITERAMSELKLKAQQKKMIFDFRYKAPATIKFVLWINYLYEHGLAKTNDLLNIYRPRKRIDQLFLRLKQVLRKYI